MNQGIPYNGELHDVDIIEYTEWEDALDNVSGKTKADRDASTDWITYDFLIGRGYFVSRPTTERPTDEKVESNVPKVDTNLPKAKMQREPKWTPSKLLHEREKLVKLQEKQLAIKQRNLLRQQERLIHAYYSKPTPKQFYHEDGTPYSKFDYGSVIMALIVLVIVILSCRAC